MKDGIEARLLAFAEELGVTFGARLGAPATVAAGGNAPGAAWIVMLRATGEAAGRCDLHIGRDGVVEIARSAAGRTDVSDSEIAGILRDALDQASAALLARAPGDRLELTIDSIDPRSAAEGESRSTATYPIAAAGLSAPLAVTFTWIDEATSGTTAVPVRVDHLGGRVDVILDIDLPVVVRFGRTELPIRELSKLGPGSVIDLGRSPDDPVEVLVSDRVVARGEVVVVGGNYGVRILDVTSQTERARSMEA